MMTLRITPEIREFYKRLTSMGGKARAKKYDHATLSVWAKRGGRPKKNESPVKGKSCALSQKGRKK